MAASFLLDTRTCRGEYSEVGLVEEDGDGDGDSDGEPPLDAGGPVAGRLEEEEQAPPSMLFLLMINSFGFSYGLTVSTLGLVILPSEALRLYHDRRACCCSEAPDAPF